MGLIRFSDKIFDKLFKSLISRYTMVDKVRSQELLIKIMFQNFMRNNGKAKFYRGFRRLKLILKFAKLIGDEIDSNNIEIGEFTLFHVRKKQLSM